MADTKVDFNVIIFDVQDPELTYCYVRIDPTPGDPMDCDHDIYGWHGKAFPARIPTAYILSNMALNSDYDPLLWPKMIPPILLHPK